MRKVYALLIVFVLSNSLISCGPQIYTNANFRKVESQHKTVAIIPFDVLIDIKRLPKGITHENIKEQQKSTGYSVQNSVYSYLLREQSRDKYSIEFQDIDKTNALLTEAGLTYEDLKNKSKEQICQLLKVDAVIGGKVITSRPMSDGAAIALGLLVGAWGSTNKTQASVTIHEAANGSLLWKYDYEANGSIGSSSQSLTNALMKNVSKKFPYKA